MATDDDRPTAAETQATHTPTTGGTRARDSRPSLPAKLGRYTVVKLLGRGGVGAVYEAEDPEVGRRVAIKVLREDRDSDAEALRGEAQALGRLVHPHVLTVYDVGIADGDVFLVMQLVEGETLDRWVAARSTTPAQILAMFIQAGQGLAAAHVAGLVHCDFKPSNVLVDHHGVVRVSDFGLARSTHRARHDAIASASMTSVAGTPAYMAPEQFDGVATAASDQFSFCVSLWEVLAGERPFEDSSIHAEDIAAARGPMRELPRSSRIPPHVKTALERGLSADPAERFPSMTALLAALQQPRSRRAPIYAGIAVVVLGGGGVIAWRAMRSAGPPPAWSGANVASQRSLTNGACDDSPIIDASGVVVFGRTIRDEVDLYSVPLAGGEVTQLTTAGTWEWRPNRGRKPGEVVHLVHDAKTSDGAQIAYLDLASKQDYMAAPLYAWDAVTIGDGIAYSPDEPSGIRRVVEHRDLSFLDPPATHGYMLVSASPAGDKLAVTETTTNDGPTHPCIVDMTTKTIQCLPTRSSDGRVAFSADGSALYFAASDGLRRRHLATGAETTFLPDVWSEGGIAVATDGSALVYSTCRGLTSVVDVGVTPHATIVEGPDSAQAVISVTGMTAWIARMVDGREMQLTDVAFGSVRAPAFSPDGTKIVFAASVPNPGIHTLRVSNPGAPHQLTSNGGDATPVWTASGMIGFTRGDATTNHAFVISADGGTEKQLTPSSRTVYGGHGNELLVDTGEADAGSLRWLDVTTGAERAGPQRPIGYIKAMSTSPDGAWIAVAIGFNGQDLWRIAAEPAGTPEHVFAYSSGITTAAIGVTNAGHVLVTQQIWAGDLFAISARSGERF
jgi:Tol biopolymer transport system component